MELRYEPFDAAISANPFDHYAALREHDPVHYCEGAHAWAISRYEDVQYVLKHPELFSSDAMASALLNLPPGTIGKNHPEALKIGLAIAEELPFVLLMYPDGAYAYWATVYDGWVFMTGQGIFHKLSFLP